MNGEVRRKLDEAFFHRLEKLKELIVTSGIEYEEAGIFGSYARGEHGALSDIDICIIGERPPRMQTGILREEADALGADIVFATREYIESGCDLLSRNIKSDYRRILP